MIEEYAVSTSQGCSAVSKHIPRKSQARGGVEQMSLLASSRNSGTAALHDSIEIPRIGSRQRIGEPGVSKQVSVGSNEYLIGRIVGQRIEVECILLFLVIRSKQAEPQSQVQREVRSDVEIVIDIGKECSSRWSPYH